MPGRRACPGSRCGALVFSVRKSTARAADRVRVGHPAWNGLGEKACSRHVPPPPGFSAKFLIFQRLRSRSRCKFLKPNKLHVNSSC